MWTFRLHSQFDKLNPGPAMAYTKIILIFCYVLSQINIFYATDPFRTKQVFILIAWTPSPIQHVQQFGVCIILFVNVQYSLCICFISFKKKQTKKQEYKNIVFCQDLSLSVENNIKLIVH